MMNVSQQQSTQFHGRVCVVTGGTQGLGETTARLFAARGAAGVAICGRNEDNGHAVAASITADTGCPALFVRTDLSDPDQCKAFVRQAGEHFGRIDTFTSCAGTTERGWIDDTTPEIWDRIFATNVRGPFFLIQEAVQWMRKNELDGATARGWIVNVISISAHGGQPFLVPYAASKGALQTLTKNLAFGLLEDRIRVNGLNIGWLNTPNEHAVQQSFHHRSPDWLEEAAPLQPFGRLIEPIDVANTIALLSSEESGVVTGSIMDFDQTIIGCRFKKPGE